MCLIPFGLGDLLSVHRRHGFAALVEPGVSLDAEQDERGNDQDHQEAHEVLLVVADGIEHAWNPAASKGM
ncbi:hypothetical protein FQZ97_1085510 [compost metagenome]